MSEDCLFLNIVTPAVPSNTGKPYPVMAYIHAGEFTLGAATDRESDWPYFADDVILVTFNSRLGPFGYFGAEDLRSRDASGGTGNFGTQDQRLALRWVQQNIAFFGGDPDSVSIWGESSGGTSVAYHLVTPASWGLFHRAIMESPGLTQTKSMANAELNYRYTLDALLASGVQGCKRTDGFDEFTGAALVHSKLHFLSATSVQQAEATCEKSSSCVGFTAHSSSSSTSFDFYADAAVVDVRARGLGLNYTSYLKAALGGEEGVQCALNADAALLSGIRDVPRSDSFETDEWAPVLDGRLLPASLTDLILQGSVAPGVEVLIGSNLDEGTIFMSLAPPISCTADEADLHQWITSFYGADISPSVIDAYANVQQPIPICHGRSHADAARSQRAAGERAPPPVALDAAARSDGTPPAAAAPPPPGKYYMTAMRTAGDFTITCRVRQAARALAQQNHSVYVYFFTHTPATSLNYHEIPSLGAFHGAEVPFAFGFPDELATDPERELAGAMGCAWRNFAATGDPNSASSACKGGAAPAQWPRFAGGAAADDATLQLDVGQLTTVRGLKNVQCDAFGL